MAKPGLFIALRMHPDIQSKQSFVSAYLILFR